MLFDIGIDYPSIGSSSSSSCSSTSRQTTISYVEAMSKRWALIFTPRLGYGVTHSSSVQVELNRSPADHIDINVNELQHPYNTQPLSHPFATYEGSLEDIDEMLRILPMRSWDEYPAFFNNCQHFVATFIIFLQAFAKERDGRSFRVTENLCMAQILIALTGSKDCRRFSNRANMLMFPVSHGVLTVVSVVAVVPAVVGGAGVAVSSFVWEKRTGFDNPRISGFPSQMSADHNRMM